MSYKFKENLLNLSHSNIYDDAILEWIYLHDIKGDELCICNHRIKNINFYYNTKTNNMIAVGDTCKKKLGLQITNNTNKYIIEAMNSSKGEYGKITDLKAYVCRIKKCIFDILKCKLNVKWSDDYNGLLKIQAYLNGVKNDIKNLSFFLDPDIFNVLETEINIKLNKINNELPEKKKLKFKTDLTNVLNNKLARIKKIKELDDLKFKKKLIAILSKKINEFENQAKFKKDLIDILNSRYNLIKKMNVTTEHIRILKNGKKIKEIRDYYNTLLVREFLN